MVRRHRYTVPALIAVFVLSVVAIVPVAANNTAQTLPFAQDWTNTNLITVNDNWSGVPGVTGFRGQDITTGVDIDPQTLLGESTLAGDLDVIPNLNTLVTNGGVGEYHLTNPVVGLQADGGSDAPYLLLHLDTTGAGNVKVAYNVRDIDGTGDNAVQQVALQYRVGASGSFTNVPAGYIADATTGPSIATLVTPVAATLPSNAAGQPLVQVRVMTTNAGVNDEWIGIDDILVTDADPSVQSVTPAPGATDVPVSASISVAFDEPVDLASGAINVMCAGTPIGGATTEGPTKLDLCSGH